MELKPVAAKSDTAPLPALRVATAAACGGAAGARPREAAWSSSHPAAAAAAVRSSRRRWAWASPRRRRARPRRPSWWWAGERLGRCLNLKYRGVRGRGGLWIQGEKERGMVRIHVQCISGPCPPARSRGGSVLLLIIRVLFQAKGAHRYY